MGIVAGTAAQFSESALNNYGGAVSLMGGAIAVGKGIQAYADARVHSEILQELGDSAQAEISPHTIELENRTLRLEGSVTEQYDEVRRALKRIYYEQLGQVLPPEDPADTEGPVSTRGAVVDPEPDAI